MLQIHKWKLIILIKQKIKAHLHNLLSSGTTGVVFSSLLLRQNATIYPQRQPTSRKSHNKYIQKKIWSIGIINILEKKNFLSIVMTVDSSVLRWIRYTIKWKMKIYTWVLRGNKHTCSFARTVWSMGSQLTYASYKTYVFL